MKRREFLSGAAATIVMAGQARADSAAPLVGFLRGGSLEEARPFIDAFKDGLTKQKPIRGLRIAFRSGQSDVEIGQQIDELLTSSVKLLVTNNQATRVAMKRTTVVPIIFSTGTDPLKSGFVSSMSRPGANVTGTTFYSTALESKRLEILKHAVPSASIIGAIIGPGTFQSQHIEQLRGAALQLSIDLRIRLATDQAEIMAAYASLLREGIQAMHISNGSILNYIRRELTSLEKANRLPTSYPVREFVEEGGLLSYRSSQRQAYREAGEYAARILNGERISDLPVITPTRFELVLNQRSAADMGVSFPPFLLAQADEVIE